MYNSRGSCRLCLTDGGTSIFESTHCEGTSLSLKIAVCLSLPIVPSDCLPSIICTNCNKMVNEFYSFREVCMKTYVTLMQFRNSEEKLAVVNKIPDGESSTCASKRSAALMNNSVEDIEFEKRESGDMTNQTEDKLLQKVGIAYELGEVVISDKHKDDASSNCEDDYDEENLLSEEELQHNCSFIKDEHFDQILDNNVSVGQKEKEGCFLSGKLQNKKAGMLITIPSSESNKCYKCSVCFKVFPTLKTLQKHLDTCLKKSIKNSDNILANQHSSEEFNVETTLQTEINKQNEKKIEERSIGDDGKQLYPCSICNKSFKVPGRLRIHLSIHTGERPFVCSLCGRLFRQLSDLRNHEMKHNGKSTHPCKQCGKGFFRPSDLEKHVRSHTGERPFMCSICSKAFHQLSGLVVHERIHTGERPYKCSICPMTFNQWANKHRHEKTHAGGAKPFVCGVCHRKYSDQREMELHQAGHGGGRPRVCRICKKGFRKPSELRDHMRRLHTNERPYKCELCSKRFFASHEVKQHLLVHTGERPYQCSSCGQAFSQKGNLRRHHLRHHKGTPFNQDHIIVKYKVEDIDIINNLDITTVQEVQPT